MESGSQKKHSSSYYYDCETEIIELSIGGKEHCHFSYFFTYSVSNAFNGSITKNRSSENQIRSRQVSRHLSFHFCFHFLPAFKLDLSCMDEDDEYLYPLNGIVIKAPFRMAVNYTLGVGP